MYRLDKIRSDPPLLMTDCCKESCLVKSYGIQYRWQQLLATLCTNNVSRSWSQRGTKVNGSHHGDNPLLRPTGIQIAKKSYATLQAMALTNIKTVHQTSLLYIESNLDRLGLLSPTHGHRSQQQSGQITLQPVLIIKPKFLKATHRTKIRKLKYRGPW